MSLKTIFSEKAIIDLAAVWEHIAAQSVEAADRFVERIHEQIALTSDHPGRGERDRRVDGRRRFLVGPYLVFYKATDEVLYVLRIYHSARRIEDITFPDEIG